MRTNIAPCIKYKTVKNSPVHKYRHQEDSEGKWRKPALNTKFRGLHYFRCTTNNELEMIYKEEVVA
jgi:hypothetical protein